MTPLLDVRDLSVRYGGLLAVDEVSMTIDRGTIVGLIGPNGAGKTTFIDALSGFVPVTGSITFDGRRVESLRPDERARLGLTRTFQSVELFDDLTLRENLLVAREQAPWWSLFVDLVRPKRAAQEHRVDELLAELGLSSYAEDPPSQLSAGRQKLAGVARALASSPQLVLLDEPAAGLDTSESELFGSHLRSFVERGTTLLLVDHDMSLVLSTCDVVWVLEFGRIIASGTPDEIRANPDVISAYLGDDGAGHSMEVQS